MATAYYDLPFFYVFDADALTDGADYNNLTVPLISDSDFILRRTCGVNNVAGKFRYRDANRMERIQTATIVPNDVVSVPEGLYPPDSQLAFDLVNVARAQNPAGGYYSQIAFQGARRFYGMQTPESSYRYYDRPYTLRADFTIDTAFGSPPIQHTVTVPDRDFELLSITALIDKTGGGNPTAKAAHDFKITLYDAKQQQLSTAPVVDEYVCAGGPDYNSIFPCPTIWYPYNSVIRFDVVSLLAVADVPATVALLFNGVWRFPC
jgi:hypothetical protein